MLNVPYLGTHYYIPGGGGATVFVDWNLFLSLQENFFDLAVNFRQTSWYVSLKNGNNRFTVVISVTYRHIYICDLLVFQMKKLFRGSFICWYLLGIPPLQREKYEKCFRDGTTQHT